MKTTELYRYTGNEAQLYGVSRLLSAEGRSDGQPVIQAYSAAGLTLDILPNTGLDIGRVSFRGINMSYISKNGYDAPSAFLPYENEFVNTFPGGMLYTCGLRSVGPANRDGAEWHPLHGRLHGLQAAQVCASVQDDYMVISGVLRESALFGHLLQLRRVIKVPVWGSAVIIEDEIKNLTPNPQAFMLLYHFNFGYPMLSEHALLKLPACKATKPRTPDAEKGLETALIFSPPCDNAAEQVFFHTMAEGEAVLYNEAVGVSATLHWNLDALPILAEWKSMASGDYALGLEPSNCYIMGRAAERENGTLKSIGGFESVHTQLRLTFNDIKRYTPL